MHKGCLKIYNGNEAIRLCYTFLWYGEFASIGCDFFFSLQKSKESFFWLEIVDFFPKARNVSSGVILNKLKLDSSVCENMNFQNYKRLSNKIFQYFFYFRCFPIFSRYLIF